MIASTRFNFSPVKSLSLTRLTAGAKRRLKLSLASRAGRSAETHVAPAASAQPTLGLLWDRSILDHLSSPLTRYHE